MTITLHEQSDGSAVALRDVVSIEQRFLRSVNLERDFYSASPLDGYIPTPSVVAALHRISEGVTAQHARAFTLTGSYGSGKSAFALFASRFLSTYGIGNLRQRITRIDPNLDAILPSSDTGGFCPILLTGAREPIGRALWLGLFRAMASNQLAKPTEAWMKSRWGELASDEVPTSRQIVELYSSIAGRIRQDDPQCRGLLVIVDELGKLLEFAALHPEQGDLQVLQELAEHAVRSGDDAILFVTILHQGFEEYAVRLSAQQRTEWQKVQGRFHDIPFGDGPEETMRLIGEAIHASVRVRQFEGLTALLADNMDACRALKLIPPTLSATEFQELLEKTYPLHPLTLRVLPFVFRRFGQNERSLFSFLSSAEAYGFQEFLQSNSLSDTHIPLLSLDGLYDYIVTTLGSSLYSHATAKLWAETEDALMRLRDSSPLQSRLIKVIGLLHILGEQTRVLPSKEMLIFALSGADVSPSEIEQAITKLQSATLITYRKFKNAYRPYEGSDIDIDARLREAQSHFSHGADGVATANTHGVTAPIVARKHSYQTGTLRFFEVRYCRPSALDHEVTVKPERADGLLILCVASNSSEASAGEAKAQELSLGIKDVIIGVSTETEMLHEAAVSVECLRWVQDNTPELRNDRVAQRELRERLFEATTLFGEQWEGLLKPQRASRSANGWYYNGVSQDVRSFRQLQELVSKACDQAYGDTPTLLNELINRRQLSSTAAAARRNLIDAMITSRGQERLSIEGYPPEASMYRSVLEATGVHREDSDGHWGFFTPEKDEALARVWGGMESFLFTGTLDPKPLPDLIALMRGKPYGMTEGVIPVFVCALLLQHEQEVVVYEDGNFVTDLDAATFERMIKQPNGFRLQGCRISGERQRVLERFARGLLRTGEEYTLVNVVRGLYRQYNRLPEYSQKTRLLPEQALAVRDLLKLGREPEQLLFADLPAALGVNPFVSEDVDSSNSDLFFTRWNAAMSEVVGAYDALLTRVEKFLNEGLGSGNWEELRERAQVVVRFATEMRLKAFVLRLSDGKHQRQTWLESVAAGMSGKPPSLWNDAEEAQFETSVSSLVSAFRNLELLAFERNQHQEDDERVGYRIAVTSNTGREDARVTLVAKDDAATVDQLSTEVLGFFDTLLKDYTDETRVAVISRLTQSVLRGDASD